MDKFILNNVLPAHIAQAEGGDVETALALLLRYVEQRRGGEVQPDLEQYVLNALEQIATQQAPAEAALHLKRNRRGAPGKQNFDRNQWIFERMQELLKAGVKHYPASDQVAEEIGQWWPTDGRSIRRVYDEMLEAHEEIDRINRE